jgi:sulfur relay (sulfurtransferase) complex TusBCD TusD component (DsrE family)
VGDASPQRPSTGTGTGNSITVKTLLRTLDVDLEAVQDDIEYCLALGFTQNEDFQKRASLVLHSSEFGNFVAAANQSKFLLVNGNNDAAQFISPLSHVCAKTIDLLSVSDDIICLTYFCSRHTDQWREPRADATGLVASLTAQLLTQIKKRRKIDGFSLDLSFLSFDDHCAVQEEDMDATFNVFQAIVKQLAKDTVIFCFIDGLSAYENFDRRQDTSRLMQSILKLVKRSKGVVFRCMVTFPGRGSFTDTWDMRSVGRKAETLEVLVGGL